jgi:hypothetical protein
VQYTDITTPTNYWVDATVTFASPSLTIKPANSYDFIDPKDYTLSIDSTLDATSNGVLRPDPGYYRFLL